MNRSKPIIKLFFIIFFGVWISACGGGGGGGSTDPDTTTATFTMIPEAIKGFSFNWPDVEGEISYRLLENHDGVSGFVEIASLPADTTSYTHIVPLHKRLNAQYSLEICTPDCVLSETLSVSGTLDGAIGYIKSSNSEAVDNFGRVIAISADGSTLAVGAPFEDSIATGINGDQDDNTTDKSGAVYVFFRNDDVWAQQAYIKASYTFNAGRFNFGRAVSISGNGNTLAVGAPNEDSDATGMNGDQNSFLKTDSGAVYLFSRTVAGVWSQTDYVKASNTDVQDYFGSVLAISSDGTTLAVSALGEDSGATGVNGVETDSVDHTDSGAVYVFAKNDLGDWSQQAYVKASNTGTFDKFGASIALSENGAIMAIGASREDSNSVDDETDNSAEVAGAAYIFTRNNSDVWSQAQYLKASNIDISHSADEDLFGASIAISANGLTVVVGAEFEDNVSTGINGDENNHSASRVPSGAIYVYQRTGLFTLWDKQAYIKASNLGERFGGSVAISGDGRNLAVGATWEKSLATGLNGDQSSDDLAFAIGAAYFFSLNDANEWTQQAYIKAPNTDEGDIFGSSIALSADGETLAVSAQGEASNATGIGGNQSDNSAGNSGAVYLY